MALHRTYLVVENGKVIGDTLVGSGRMVSKLAKNGVDWVDLPIKLASWHGLSFGYVDITGQRDDFARPVSEWCHKAPPHVMAEQALMQARLEAEGVHQVYTPEHYAATEGQAELRPEPRRPFLELD